MCDFSPLPHVERGLTLHVNSQLWRAVDMHRCRNHSCLCTVNSCSTPTSRQVDFPSFCSLHWLEAPYVLPRETQTGSNKHCYNHKAYSWWHLAILAKVLSVSLPFFSCCRSAGLSNAILWRLVQGWKRNYNVWAVVAFKMLPCLSLQTLKDKVLQNNCTDL